jgi:methylenetetrahydrofolate reductase (NADPH)
MTTLGASIEVSVKELIAGKPHPGTLPTKTRVYIPDIGIDPVSDLIQAARIATDMDCHAVPHIAARRIDSADALERRLSRVSALKSA